MTDDTPEYTYRPTANETLLHFAKQIAARAGQTTTTLIINDKAFTVAQGWQQRGLWFATATDEAGETCLLTSPDGRDWEVLEPPTSQYVNNGIYRYGRTAVLYQDGHWLMLGWDRRMQVDRSSIGDLLFVLD